MRSLRLLVLVSALSSCTGGASTTDATADDVVGADSTTSDVVADGSVDADASAGTSLVGSIPCGSATCGDGEVCLERFGGDVVIDEATGQPAVSHTCATAPSDCVLSNCDFSSCSTMSCARTLCAPGQAYRVEGRVVTCADP